MSTPLDKIIEEVQQLPPDEQRQLRERLNAIVPSQLSEDELEDAFERDLIAEGVLWARSRRFLMMTWSFMLIALSPSPDSSSPK